LAASSPSIYIYIYTCEWESCVLINKHDWKQVIASEKLLAIEMTQSQINKILKIFTNAASRATTTAIKLFVGEWKAVAAEIN